jgi:predicted GIY-YIG superfamily endonuclease
VFCENGRPLYVGETGDTSRRIYREHCSAHIGGSEGVVRFLMYYLDRIAETVDEWAGLSPLGRERYVKEFLRQRMESLALVIILDSRGELRDGRRRREVERCLRAGLRPVLNPV